nr:PREDICTED: tRNA (guanine(37)-N1)-methyltransferase [Lepisosteus oculatus]
MIRALCRIFTFVNAETSLRRARPPTWLFAKRCPRFPGAALSAQRCGAQQAMPEQQQGEAEPGLLAPPPGVRGMTTLDRSAFRKRVAVPALRVRKEAISPLVKALKRVALQLPAAKRVVEDPQDEDHRLVLLDPSAISSPDSFPEAEAAALRRLGVSPEVLRYELELTYEHLKSDEVLRAVLPPGQDVTSGFSRVGHIAHLNLRDHQLPFRKLIGQVIMDKNPGVTCVVNKTNTIDSTYRNFQMEVLAGDGNMVAKVRENNVSYEFDFSRVYWNPRLSTEHERIVGLLQRGDSVFDVFAGVGPFAIPAARRGCSVFANDLNPESFKWLQHNCKLNKTDSKVRTFNMDGRDFIGGPLREELPGLLEMKSRVHIIMNLPALALEFLDALKGLLEQGPDSDDVSPPHVHCYGFSKHDDPRRDVTERASASLGTPLEGRCSVHTVRNVAPNKEMMCISFPLPWEVLFKKPRSPEPGTPDEPAPKRPRSDEPTA